MIVFHTQSVSISDRGHLVTIFKAMHCVQRRYLHVEFMINFEGQSAISRLRLHPQTVQKCKCVNLVTNHELLTCFQRTELHYFQVQNSIEQLPQGKILFSSPCWWVGAFITYCYDHLFFLSGLVTVTAGGKFLHHCDIVRQSLILGRFSFQLDHRQYDELGVKPWRVIQ